MKGLLLVLCLTLVSAADTARAADPLGYSFVVYWPSLLGGPFAFRGEGHVDLRHCNRIRSLAVEKIAQFTGGPGKFSGSISPCAIGPPTVIFPSE